MFLGIDIGTSGVKAVVLDEHGAVAAQGLAARSPELSFLLYLLPLTACVFAAIALADIRIIPESLRRLFRAPVGEPA